MPSSSDPNRHNACKACTIAKRACDRQVPRCGRCADRLLECQYFGRARHGGNFLGRTKGRPALLAPKPPHRSCTFPIRIQQLHEFQIPNEIESQPPKLSDQSPLVQLPCGILAHTLDHPASEWVGVSLQPQPIFVPTPHNKQNPFSNKIHSERGWFLQPESWEIKRTYTASPADPQTVFKSFVKTAKTWLRDFSTTGHNLFIHHQLYHPDNGHHGMPSYVQDAWLTLTAYLAKTEQTEAMVFQIMDGRARKLLSGQDKQQMNVRDQLARTHALLIYTLIRLLFDNSSFPRQRTEALESLPVLAAWCHEMRDAAVEEAASLFRTAQSISHISPTSQEEIEQDALWQAFIISESIRRTWMLASATLRVFTPWPGTSTREQESLDLSTVTKNRCLGFLSFTIRVGLWEAKSASEWAGLQASRRSITGGPGPVTSHQDPRHQSESQNMSEEVDDHQAPSDGQLWNECPKTIITSFIQDLDMDRLYDNGGGISTSVTPVFLESVGIVDRVLEETRPEDVDSWTNQIFRMGRARDKFDAWLKKGRGWYPI